MLKVHVADDFTEQTRRVQLGPVDQGAQTGGVRREPSVKPQNHKGPMEDSDITIGSRSKLIRKEEGI